MMRVRVGWAVVIAAVLFGVGACYKQVPNQPTGGEGEAVEESDKDIVEFSFGWEDGESFGAKTTQTMSRDNQVQSEVSSSYTVKAKSLGDDNAIEDIEGGGDEDLRVKFEANLDDLDAGSRASVSRVVNAASVSAMPDIVVGPDGSFKKVDNLIGVRSTFQEAAKKAAGSQKQRQKLNQVLNKLLGEKMLKSRARQQWDMLVGLWAGDKFAIGESYESEVEDTFQLPMAGQQKIKMDVEFSPRERVKCGAGDGQKCVRLKVKSKPDTRKMEEMMQSWVDKFSEMQANRQGMKNVPDLEVKNFFLRTKVDLVTDPSTLLPTEKTEKKTIRMTLKAPNGETKKVKSVRETKTTFDN